MKKKIDMENLNYILIFYKFFDSENTNDYNKIKINLTLVDYFGCYFLTFIFRKTILMYNKIHGSDSLLKI